MPSIIVCNKCHNSTNGLWSLKRLFFKREKRRALRRVLIFTPFSFFSVHLLKLIGKVISKVYPPPANKVERCNIVQVFKRVIFFKYYHSPSSSQIKTLLPRFSDISISEPCCCWEKVAPYKKRNTSFESRRRRLFKISILLKKRKKKLDQGERKKKKNH